MKRIAYSIILLLTISKSAIAQSGSVANSFFVGDTALAAIFTFSNLTPPAQCGSIISASTSGGSFSSNGSYPLYIYFAPSKPGFDTTYPSITLSCPHWIYPTWTAEGLVFEYAQSDSFPKIRPQGWSIKMTPDSLGKVWTNHSAPTFDNPIPDTTTFSEFKATPSNGASCSLQVLDSITTIAEYRPMPFVRKHPLNLIFSSQNYLSFETVIFTTRMRHGNVDSVISYALPVTWVAPLGVAADLNSTINYALPNPFSNQLAIGFTLEKPEDVKLTLFDLTGREVRSEEQELYAGSQEIKLDTRDLQAGSYYYVLRGSEWNRIGKLVKMEP